MVENGWNPEQWLTFFRIEAPLVRYAPLAPTAGNHDVGLYPEVFSVPLNLHSLGAYYSWDYGPIHFLSLCSEIPGPEQDSSLAADLARLAASETPPRFIIVAIHRNVYSNGGHPGDENYPYSTLWGPLFEQHNVALVIQGHSHFYERFEPIAGRTGLGDPPGSPDIITTGVTYVTSAGGGAPLYPVPPPPGNGGGGTPPLNTLVAESVYHAMLLEVQDRTLHVRVYRLDDSRLLDEFFILR
jgi:hypothetical protein